MGLFRYTLPLLLGILLARPVCADEPAPDAANQPAEDLSSRQTLLGDAGGVRPFLAKYGLTLGVIETDEVLGNITGGLKQGAIYEGLTDLSLNFDLRTNYAIRGNFFAHAYQIHGRGLTANNLGNLDTVSGIEASRTTRLAEFWYEHHFDFNWLRIKVGEQTVTTDYLNPESARIFIDGAFGWPTLPSLDLPSGGPGFPLAAPAVRVRIDPSEGFTWFTSVFDGDPTGGGVGASQLRDPSGTAFRTSDGAFIISELRYNEDSSPQNTTYRFGGWYNTERFRDLRLDLNGVSLASPASAGQARLHDGDYSFYAIIDAPFVDDEKTGFTVFARAMGAPGDRNLISFYGDAGVTYRGPFGRKDDVAGIAAGYARIGDAARQFDRDVGTLTGALSPVRSGETLIEATYRFQLAPWWQVQPDLQYIINPGGGVLNPSMPTHRIGDALVLGLRTAITF